MPEIRPFFYVLYYHIIPKLRYFSDNYLEKGIRKILEFLLITALIYFTLSFSITLSEYIIGYQPFDLIHRLINSSVLIEAPVKLFVFGALIIFYYLKYRKKISHIPKINWGITLSAFIFFSVVGIRDAATIYSRFNTSHNQNSGIISEVTKGTVYEYYSGIKGMRLWHFFIDGGLKVLGLYDLFMEKKILLEGWRIRKKTRFFPYTCKVSRDAEIMIRNGWIRSPEELHYVVTVMDKEAGFDPKTTSRKKTLEGLHGVAWVIKNRFRSKQFPHNLYDIVMERRIYKNRVIWQFECVQKKPHLFTFHGRFHQLPLYSDGKIQTRKKSLAYKALIDVFIRGIKDPTKGARFYYNPDLAVVNIKSSRITRRINSHLFYR